MKKMNWMGLLLTLSVGLMACDPVKSVLEVTKPFAVQTSRGEKVQLATGHLPMTLNIYHSKMMTAEIQSQGQTLTVNLQIPAHKEIPDNGSVTLTSQETGQPFDLVLHNQTEEKKSNLIQTHETCEFSYQERICEFVPGPPNQPPTQHCWYETFIRPGFQEVDYHRITKTTQISALLFTEGSPVGQTSGTLTKTEKQYTYKGDCVGPRH